MIDIIIKHSIAFLYLLAGSISDLKTREVADWANYGLMTLGIATNLILSIVYKDPHYILTSIAGFGVFWLLALGMFYAGQWGGGDSKMLMGLGALYGLWFNWNDSSFLIFFLVNTLIAGAVYGIGWTIYLAARNWKTFKKTYETEAKKKQTKTAKLIIYILLVLLIILSFALPDIQIKIILLSLAILLLSTFYLWLLIRSVENSCMYKLVEPSKLTEGDWIAKDVRCNGKYICGPKDLGIEKKQISILKKLYSKGQVKKILVKEGIPFVPSFFLGWIMTILLGNVLSHVIF